MNSDIYNLFSGITLRIDKDGQIINPWKRNREGFREEFEKFIDAAEFRYAVGTNDFIKLTSDNLDLNSHEDLAFLGTHILDHQTLFAELVPKKNHFVAMNDEKAILKPKSYLGYIEDGAAYLEEYGPEMTENCILYKHSSEECWWYGFESLDYHANTITNGSLFITFNNSNSGGWVSFEHGKYMYGFLNYDELMFYLKKHEALLILNQ